MPNPICLQCGIELHAYRPQQYARCDTCYDNLSQLPDALSAPEDLLVRVAYHSGFAEDLTGWHTEFFSDSRIKQSIHWDPRVHGKDRPPELTGELSAHDFIRVSESLSAIDLSSLAVFNNWRFFDDAPKVNLFSPSHNLHASVDQFHLDNEDMPEEAKAGMASFQRAWKLLDSRSPYTKAAHYK